MTKCTKNPDFTDGRKGQTDIFVCTAVENFHEIKIDCDYDCIHLC